MSKGARGCDIIRDYLSQIGEILLLTQQQEVELSRRVVEYVKIKQNLDKGLSFSDIANSSGKTEADLRRTYQSGLIARRKFANSNLRLVVSIAY
jgi:DNA-directed RNA polymerase sigma subunit (sigma70/sigma32)